MKKTAFFAGVLALASAFQAHAAPVINSILTSYSGTGVPTTITVFGTGLCATSTCGTKPTITLGGVALSGISATATTASPVINGIYTPCSNTGVPTTISTT